METMQMVKVEKLVPELRFKEFEEGWNLHKLGELGTFKNGLNKDSSEFGHGSPFVNLMDVFGKTILTESNFGLVNSNEKDKENYNLIKGDVLFIRSSVKRTGVGETILVANDIPNTVYSGFLIRFRDRNKELGLNFKSYCFSNAPFRKELLSYATSSANTNINQESLAQIKLYFPSLPEQQKIASFLSAVDEKIQQLTRKKELLEQYKKGVMQQLFSGKLRFKDEAGKDYPKWEVKRLDEVANFRRGSFPQPYGLSKWFDEENGSPFVQVYDVDDNMLLKPSTKSKISKLATEQSVFVKEGTLVITIQGSIGRIAKTQYDSYVDRTLLIFQSYKKPIDVDYFKYVVYLLFEIEKTKAPGGTIKTITKEALSSFKIMIPQIIEQQKIANFLSSIDSKIESTNQQITQTQTFKKGLLQKMFVAA